MANSVAVLNVDLIDDGYGYKDIVALVEVDGTPYTLVESKFADTLSMLRRVNMKNVDHGDWDKLDPFTQDWVRGCIFEVYREQLRNGKFDDIL